MLAVKSRPMSPVCPKFMVTFEVRFTVESKPFGIDLDMVESDGDIYVVKVGGDRIGLWAP